MKTPEISFVYPTRNRPEFMNHALSFVSRNDLSGVQILIVDNSDPGNDLTLNAVQDFLSEEITYVRTSGKLSMVDNWEFALNCSRGDFVGFLTDKMFLLPGSIERLRAFVQTNSFDILSWFEDFYTPFKFSSYFGDGIYTRRRVDQTETFEKFDPLRVLYQKLENGRHRSSMSPLEYSMGKICYGLFSRRLIEQIVKTHGQLFFPMAPDYTSMTLALGTAEVAYSTNFAGILHVNTNISNGLKVSSDDQSAASFLNSFSDADAILAEMPIAGLYTSISNIVLHDYLSMFKKMELPPSENLSHWYRWMTEEVLDRNRTWSSENIRNHQSGLLFHHLGISENNSDWLMNQSSKPRSSIRAHVYNSLPMWAKRIVQRQLGDSANIILKSIDEVLKF